MGYVFFTIAMLIAAIIGGAFNYVLYRNVKRNRQDEKFYSSENLLGYFIEIIIAIVGVGITLYITNIYEEQQDKEAVIAMMEQTNDFIEGRLEYNKDFFYAYEHSACTVMQMKESTRMDFVFFDNVLANEQVMRYMDMTTYGHIMQYVMWARTREAELDALDLKDVEEESIIYAKMLHRDYLLEKVKDFIDISVKQMRGEITREEAVQECDTLRREEIMDYSYEKDGVTNVIKWKN